MSGCIEGCGACCDPITLPYSPIELTKLPIGALHPETLRWVQNDLIHISRREGLRRASPLIENGRTVEIVSTREELMRTYFYQCRHFDHETRACGNYEGRPPICRDYPWFNRRPDPTRGIPAECGFLPDVGQTPVPIPTRR